MSLAIGAATAEPLPPLSTITDTTISGLSNGAKLIKRHDLVMIFFQFSLCLNYKPEQFQFYQQILGYLFFYM